MFYTSIYNPMPTEVVFTNHKSAIINRIVECFYTDHAFRACVVDSQVVPRLYDARHGMPNGYEYELVDGDLSDLLLALEANGIWTVRGLDHETKKTHMAQLQTLRDIVQSELDRVAWSKAMQGS